MKNHPDSDWRPATNGQVKGYGLARYHGAEWAYDAAGRLRTFMTHTSALRAAAKLEEQPR